MTAMYTWKYHQMRVSVVFLLFCSLCLLQISDLDAFLSTACTGRQLIQKIYHNSISRGYAQQFQTILKLKDATSSPEGMVQSVRAGDYRKETFSADLLDTHYKKQPLQVLKRCFEIGSPIASWWLATKVDGFTSSWRNVVDQRSLQRRRAAQLKEAIVQGKSVTFIKSGQALALRPDILKSQEYVEELQKLQDEVGTFDDAIAMQIIAEDLGQPAHEIFDFDPPHPIASASIGQVYRARLKSTNEIVAVKVQRPDTLRTVPVDLYILRQLARVLRDNKRKLRSNLVNIADTFGAQLYNELDYVQEAANCKKFKRCYGDIPGIYVPAVYDKYSSKRVLTLEFVEGVKGPWVSGGEKMLTTGLQCSVLQLLGTGFFHSDPHRGNLLQTLKGELAYLDFGMMTEIPSDQRYALLGMILGLANQDLPLMIRSMETLEFFVPGTNVTQVIAALEVAVQDATSSNPDRKEAMLNPDNLNFTRLNENIIKLQHQLPIQLPAFYPMIIRSLTMLEGLAQYVDKDFKLVKGAYPFVANQILSNPTPELNRLLKSVMLTEEGRIRWDKLEALLSIAASANDAVEKGNFQGLKDAQDRSDVLKRLRNPTIKIDNSYNITIEVVSRVLDYLLSENGNYLREPLIDEIIEVFEELGLGSQRLISLATLGIIPSPKQNPDREKLMSFFQLLVSQSNRKPISAAVSTARRGDKGSAARLSARTSIVTVLTQSFALLQEIIKSPQLYNVQLEEVLSIVSRLTLLAKQVVGKVAERNTKSFVHNVVTPERVEFVLPLLSKALGLVPVNFVGGILDRSASRNYRKRAQSEKGRK